MTPWTRLVLDRLQAPVLDALGGTPGVWVVGGAVRDALLGRQPRELDLVVEGDAVALARRLGDPVAVHERFGTAALAGVDLAAARIETYARPGALPDVELGASIREDLRRRDFSVNAMAVHLADGRGAAWPSAHDDLAQGVLRVLHDRSFLDDPTRLLRGVRYGARLGFRYEPETDALAAQAVAAGAPATVTGARLGGELRLLLGEPLPRSLLALAGHGLGAAVLHPSYAPDGGRIAAVLRHGSPLAALGSCLLDAPAAELRAALDRLAFPAPERDAVVAAAGGRDLAERLLAAASPSAVAAAARHARPEALAVAAAYGAAEPVRSWLDTYRHVELAITGEDLLAAGLSGPAVGAGLRAAMAAALDGRAPDREAQLRAARDGVA
jgi:tRNA nucleotidyltransferase (CCA-adding enzyme)